MDDSQSIWLYEVDQADRIARCLIETKKISIFSKILLFPFYVIAYLRYRRTLSVTRKNLLYTKQLALDAAKDINQGYEREERIASINRKTKETLDKEGKGLYTDKVRRKQFKEIDVLINHYQKLLNSEGEIYDEMIRTAYQSRQGYLAFVKKLQWAEKEVIQAAISSVRKGSRNERMAWFRKVEEATEEARKEETDRIFN